MSQLEVYEFSLLGEAFDRTWGCKKVKFAWDREPEIDFRIGGTSTYANCLNIFYAQTKKISATCWAIKLTRGSKFCFWCRRLEAKRDKETRKRLSRKCCLKLNKPVLHSFSRSAVLLSSSASSLYRHFRSVSLTYKLFTFYILRQYFWFFSPCARSQSAAQVCECPAMVWRVLCTITKVKTVSVSDDSWEFFESHLKVIRNAPLSPITPIRSDKLNISRHFDSKTADKSSFNGCDKIKFQSSTVHWI